MSSFNSSLLNSNVGSESWMDSEIERAQHMIAQDVEDFQFTARRELEWITEYIRDLTEKKDLADLLKTPGRMKGAVSPRKMKMMSVQQQSGVKINGSHVHFDQSPIRITNSPFKVEKSPVMRRTPKGISALNNALEIVDLKHPSIKVPHEFSDGDDSSDHHADAENEEDASFIKIRKSIRPTKQQDEVVVRNLAFKKESPAEEVVATDDDEKLNINTQASLQDSLPIESKSSTPARGEHVNSSVKPLLPTTTPKSVTIDESSKIFETDSEDEEEEDGKTPIVNKSSFGFTGLPKKQPVVKKSFARTPSTSNSLSRTEASTVSKLRRDPSSFNSKLSSTSTAATSATSSILEPKDQLEQLSSQRVSIHYPKIEHSPEPFNVSTAAMTPKPEKVAGIIDDDDLSPPELTPPSTFKRPTAEDSKVSPVKLVTAPASPAKLDTQKTAASPAKLATGSTPWRSPSKTWSIRSNKTRSPSKEEKRLDKKESPSKAEGGLFALANGMIRSAKNMFSRESPEQAKKPKDKEPKEEEPRTVRKNETISRLMAPTFASSVRSATTNRAQSPTREVLSPLQEKRPLYPELPKLAHTKPAKPLLPATVATTPKSPVRDTTKKNLTSTKPSKTLTSLAKPEKDTVQKHEPVVPVPPPPQASALPTRILPSVEQKSARLTKQTLQAKKITSSAATSKPLHVKVPTAATRENNGTKAPQNIKSSSNSTRVSTSLSSKTLPAKVSKDAEAKPSAMRLKLTNTSKQPPAPSQSKEPKLLKRNIALENESSRVGGSKRTSDQAALDSTEPKKPARGYSNSKPPSLMKTAVMHQAKNAATTNNNALPQVDGVKFSNDMIRFNTPSGPSRTSTTKNNIFRQAPTISATNSSVHQVVTPASKTNGDHIILPEIMSESEDDEDGNVLQDWANSPELRSMLVKQQQVNPDAVFGPIAPLHMDEIFRNSSRLSRFRPRSSSANWSNTDRLTADEVEQYASQMGYKS